MSGLTFFLVLLPVLIMFLFILLANGLASKERYLLVALVILTISATFFIPRFQWNYQLNKQKQKENGQKENNNEKTKDHVATEKK